MSSEPTTAAIQSRLRALFEIVVAEASDNPRLRSALEEVLLSPEVKVKIKARRAKGPKIAISPVEILQKVGESGLRDELSRLTNDQIQRIIKDEKYGRSQEIREADRDALVTLILEKSRKRLNQGSVFLRSA